MTLRFPMICKEKLRFGLREAAVLRKRKEPKTKKSIALTLRRDLQGSAAEKLRMFEKVRAAASSRRWIRPRSPKQSGCCVSLWRWREGAE